MLFHKVGVGVLSGHQEKGWETGEMVSVAFQVVTRTVGVSFKTVSILVLSQSRQLQGCWISVSANGYGVWMLQKCKCCLTFCVHSTSRLKQISLGPVERWFDSLHNRDRGETCLNKVPLCVSRQDFNFRWRRGGSNKKQKCLPSSAAGLGLYYFVGCRFLSTRFGQEFSKPKYF